MSLSLHALRLAGCLSAVASCALLLRRLLASRPRRLAERSCAACRPTLREHGGEPRKRCVRTAPPVAEAAAPLATAQADPSDARARARAHLRFGNLCARGGRPEKALSQYLAAARADPAYATARHNCGGVCQRLRRFAEAAEHYEAALALKPRLVEAATNLAVAQLNAGAQLSAAGDAASAGEWYRSAVESAYRAMRVQAGAVEGGAGRAEGGETQDGFDSGGFNSGGFNSEAFANLNVALRLVGERERAVRETWAAVASLSPAGFTRPPPAPAPPHLSRCLSRCLSCSASGSPSSGPTPPAALTVACVKWGDKYGPEYVNRLYAMVARRLPGVPFRFACLTEQPRGLRREVEPLPLPAASAGWRGWWLKACLFTS
ncbi:hypothetical protein EMIHUDRAFT_213884 [Emiliania huxleyi CCMP1516]|uniref:Uncharacterized protein n=2 Tax=Emiliania huxleyi TaxID=2903 RepID=A0A0D3ILH7_EMIH1|nr:hypothetical protein EMIHUDRAFT_213884 [Emiliania huxleyi CCMP1516]EOD12112.1 hypothetical protein EMIHUDRAFT_213884 [Emiliania huxleyi CCMP1516]|eukprot:XP_005764541.1 hypothetical protein EMIHUDRAFT_213884 [Emiliania huxleyi CCMP1516]